MPPKKEEVIDLNKLPPIKKITCLILYNSTSSIK